MDPRLIALYLIHFEGAVDPTTFSIEANNIIDMLDEMMEKDEDVKHEIWKYATALKQEKTVNILAKMLESDEGNNAVSTEQEDRVIDEILTKIDKECSYGGRKRYGTDEWRNIVLSGLAKKISNG